MLRISKLTDYAVVLMTRMAADGQMLTVAQLHHQTTLPIPTTAKILKRLARSGLLTTTRGAAGGYRLARTPGEISVVDIIEAMDGPIAMTDCVEGASKACTHVKNCHLQPNWNKVNAVVRQTLQQMKLSDLAMLQGGSAKGPCEAA